jgi:restriction endonuclease Mrr
MTVRKKPVALSPPSPTLQNQVSLPQNIPLTLPDVIKKLSHEEFELFSAAIIIGQGNGHQFVRHSGKSGDRGVDVHMKTREGNLVIVQAKHHALTNTVGSPALQRFGGALHQHKPVYGFIVTTSSFSSEAIRYSNSHGGRIRMIDGHEIEVLLRTQPHAVAKAYTDIQEKAQQAKQTGSWY